MSSAKYRKRMSKLCEFGIYTWLNILALIEIIRLATLHEDITCTHLLSPKYKDTAFRTGPGSGPQYFSKVALSIVHGAITRKH
jgi:hypothetical protein